MDHTPNSFRKSGNSQHSSLISVKKHNPHPLHNRHARAASGRLHKLRVPKEGHADLDAARSDRVLEAGDLVPTQARLPVQEPGIDRPPAGGRVPKPRDHLKDRAAQPRLAMRPQPPAKVREPA
eukprot:4181967-Prymnesium_polylepis.1